jgi:hypothetical protein
MTARLPHKSKGGKAIDETAEQPHATAQPHD